MRMLVFLIPLSLQLAVAQPSPHGKINIACEACHTSDSWSLRTDATFNHDSTGFALAGQHKFVECRSCHEKLVFKNKSSDCSSCHTDVHRDELGANCLRCHTTGSWAVADMKQKHQETRFPLLGSHALALCEGCHERATSHRYAGTPLACISCHKSDFDGTTSPSHVSSGFPIDCNRCHATEALKWSGGFDHNLTGFPLTGAHRAIICSECHKNNQFTKLSSNCFDCHSADFTHAQSPNHLSGNFSHDCLSCHTKTAWQPARFDHNATRFPLTGKHTSALCQACHTGGNYQLVYLDCYQCHQSDYQRPTDPNHGSAGFSHNCLDCHSTTTWSGSSFDHSKTNFALTGKHVTTACQTCHASGNYQLTYSSCYQCHQNDYQQSANPNHVAGNYDHNCTQCHSTVSWSSSTFDHTTTRFPLTGKHLSTLCQSCHTNNNFQLTFSECYQCHQSDYQLPVNPNHVSANLGHDCTPCHTTTAWLPSTFNHDVQYFKIYSGTHQGRWTTCADCHQNNTHYAEFSCLNCHTHNQTDTDRQHVQVSGYSYTSAACYSCHRNR